MELKIKVPGEFAKKIAFLDLETTKTPTPQGYRMPNGEVLRNRWKIGLAGVALDGVITIVGMTAEHETLDRIGELLPGSGRVVYGATREFDEMICRGRFTNARRAHLPAPAFPAVPGAETFLWDNAGTDKPQAPRGPDILSCDISVALRGSGRVKDILVHNLRDVAELILLKGNPDREAKAWCEKVLIDYFFAAKQIERGTKAWPEERRVSSS